MIKITNGAKTVEVDDEVFKSVIRARLSQLTFLEKQEKRLPAGEQAQLKALHDLAYTFEVFR